METEVFISFIKDINDVVFKYVGDLDQENDKEMDKLSDILNVIDDLGNEIIEIIKQKRKGYYKSPTDLGKQISKSISGNQINKLLEKNGYQKKEGKRWKAIGRGIEFSKEIDGRLYWSPGVIVCMNKALSDFPYENYGTITYVIEPNNLNNDLDNDYDLI